MGAEIILRRVELRLAHEHRAAHGTVSTRPTLLVEFRQMHDGTAVSGWGECPALPDPGYFHEYTDGAQAMLTNLLIPAVVAGGSLSPDAVDAATAIAPGHPMARSALALAAEDLTARAERSTLSQRWGRSATGCHPVPPSAPPPEPGPTRTPVWQSSASVRPSWPQPAIGG